MPRQGHLPARRRTGRAHCRRGDMSSGVPTSTASTWSSGRAT